MLRNTWSLARETVSNFMENNGLSRGAAIAFYAVTSIGPVLLLIVAVAVLVALRLWGRYESDPWTRDGQIRADVVRVTPDVGGLVTAVAVRDNQPVRPGQLLFVVDRPRYQLALEQAKASVASAQATVAQDQREVRRDLGRDGGIGAHRRAQHHAVRTLHRFCGIDLDVVSDAQLHRPIETLLSASIHDDFCRYIAPVAADARDR